MAVQAGVLEPRIILTSFPGALVKLNPLTLYRVLRALNPSPYMYLLDSGENQIVGASPVMLMRVHDGLLNYRPIAGTRPRGVN